MQLFKAASKAALEFMQLHDAIACDYRVAEEIIRAITIPDAAPANSDPAQLSIRCSSAVLSTFVLVWSGFPPFPTHALFPPKPPSPPPKPLLELLFTCPACVGTDVTTTDRPRPPTTPTTPTTE